MCWQCDARDHVCPGCDRTLVEVEEEGDGWCPDDFEQCEACDPVGDSAR